MEGLTFCNLISKCPYLYIISVRNSLKHCASMRVYCSSNGAASDLDWKSNSACPYRYVPGTRRETFEELGRRQRSA